MVNGAKVEQVFVTDWQDGQWQRPVEVLPLRGTDAGYFQIHPDGTLYYFCWKPKSGIYYSKPDSQKIYGEPIWLSDVVGLEESTSFDVLVHPDKTKLIISQYYAKKMHAEYGEPGFYYYEKKGDQWQRIQRLPLGYGWGANITADGNFVFVRGGQLRTIPVNELGIEW